MKRFLSAVLWVIQLDNKIINKDYGTYAHNPIRTNI